VAWFKIMHSVIPTLFFVLFWNKNALYRFWKLISSFIGRHSAACGRLSRRLWRQIARLLRLATAIPRLSTFITIAAAASTSWVQKQPLVVPHEIVVALGRLSQSHVHLWFLKLK